MIKIPVYTMDLTRRGLVVWDAGQVSVEAGSLLPDDVTAVQQVLNAPHRWLGGDVAPADDLEAFEDMQGVATVEHLLLHVNHLTGAGYLPRFDQSEGIDQ